MTPKPLSEMEPEELLIEFRGSDWSMNISRYHEVHTELLRSPSLKNWKPESIPSR